MRVLLVGGDSWVVRQTAQQLHGHEVAHCSADGAPAFPCAKFTTGVCPVEAGVEVAVLVRARPSQDVLPGELGAVCALRAGVPLVAAGLTEGSPFAELVAATVPKGGDLAHVCEAAAVVDVRAG